MKNRVNNNKKIVKVMEYGIVFNCMQFKNRDTAQRYIDKNKGSEMFNISSGCYLVKIA